ncbi:DNA repair photolyase [Dongia mobilis]|uniref:DNA repair photolyase n=1 Tax=Dongia mobilis TaxID=578943 RepID=A0A4V3DE37_9PROT|nr:PA0069 family radical SAM protein [Dongia mobilis]TDQ78481.1 DNA repair photolyase [Dongia mobilis]
MRYERDLSQLEPDIALPAMARKGRGAVTNKAGRFERGQRPLEDDGWQQGDAAETPVAALTFRGTPVRLDSAKLGRNEPADEDALPPLRTSVALDSAKSIISRNQSPDIPFDQSINPYRGCEHGCIYCYARPSHAYLGHSPGLDFETRLYMKADAAQLLERELRRPGYRPTVIALGANTDPYQPIERRYRLTREILEVLSAYNHAAGITTKSANVTRDVGLLADMAKRKLMKVYISVTTLDRDLARVMEPRASAPARRLEAIRTLSNAGVPVGISVAPIIPALTDHEIEAIVKAGAEAGASSVSWTVLRMPLEIKELFTEWLEAHHPLKAKRIMDLVRDCHGGALYKSDFGSRMKGTGPYAALIRRRVLTAARKYGLDGYKWDIDTGRFAIPGDRPAPLSGRDSGQLSLFG